MSPPVCHAQEGLDQLKKQIPQSHQQSEMVNTWDSVSGSPHNNYSISLFAHQRPATLIQHRLIFI